MTAQRLTRTQFWLVSCFAILIGLVLARRPALKVTLLALLVVGLVVAIKFRFILVVLFCFCLGYLRGYQYFQQLGLYQSYYNKPTTIRAVADTDAIYGRASQLNFDVVNIKTQNHINLAGRVKVEGYGSSMVYKGDELQIAGRLSPTKGSAQAKISYANIKVLHRQPAIIDNLRRRFTASLESVLPEPQAPFSAGLLIGQRSTIPAEVNDQLSITGLSHLVAVSGYNLTIIIMAARKLAGKRSKFQTTLLAGLLVVLFVLFTGLSASIIRAALVSGLSLITWYYGRAIKPSLLIIGSAALTALWNPFYLWSDIGWYLSFLAFFGVLIIGPLLALLLGRGKQPGLVGGVISETVAAQIMTLPIIMYIFGRVSVVGLVANVLVVPLVPAAMFTSLIVGVIGIIELALAIAISWPARLLLTYMLDLVKLFSQVPHASVQQKISLSSMCLSYFGLALLTLFLRSFLRSRKWLEYGKITE